MLEKKWTDRKLKKSVKKRKRINEVCKDLGLEPNRRETIKKRIRDLNLNVDHFEEDISPCRKKSWNDKQLINAVKQSSTYREVHRCLGLTNSPAVRERIKELNLDTNHFSKKRWNDKEFIKAVKRSKSRKEVGEKMGMYPYIRDFFKHIERLGLDISHFENNEKRKNLKTCKTS